MLLLMSCIWRVWWWYRCRQGTCRHICWTWKRTWQKCFGIVWEIATTSRKPSRSWQIFSRGECTNSALAAFEWAKSSAQCFHCCLELGSESQWLRLLFQSWCSAISRKDDPEALRTVKHERVDPKRETTLSAILKANSFNGLHWRQWSVCFLTVLPNTE